MEYRKHVGALLSLVACLSSTSCSSFLVHGPETEARPGKPLATCTSENGAPLVDTAIAAILLFPTILFATVAAESSDGYKRVGLTLMGASLVPAVGYGLSAGYGFWKTAECRAVIAEGHRLGLRPSTYAEPKERRREFADRMSGVYASRTPPVRVEALGPEATVLVIQSPSCATPESPFSALRDRLDDGASGLKYGFTKVTCLRDAEPTPGP